MMNLLVVSYNGFSDTNANGKTLKTLLGGFPPEQVMQICRGTEEPDFSACSCCFRVTDGQLFSALLGKKSRHCFLAADAGPSGRCAESTHSAGTGRIRRFLKRNHYNYVLRSVREFLFEVAPWGKRDLLACTEAFRPDAIVYMVGDQFSLDRLVLELQRRYRVPLILFHTEAYRLVDPKTRRGTERRYFKKIRKTYRRLADSASLILYNCGMLRDAYREQYGSGGLQELAYNSAVPDCTPYRPETGRMNIAYFGNIGVGRTQSLLELAQALARLDPALGIDVYAKALPEQEQALKEAPNIRFHGFVGQDVLREVREDADILLHAESFDPEIMPKLRYAFSTKIAQCLCSGRCLVSYAPEQTASSRYLKEWGCGVVITSAQDLEAGLRSVLTDGEKRAELARKALETGRKNHDASATARRIAGLIGALEPPRTGEKDVIP